jgi:hypothetical protein
MERVSAARHPLDAAEMRQAAAILRAGGRLREGVKAIGFILCEPTRDGLRALSVVNINALRPRFPAAWPPSP